MNTLWIAKPFHELGVQELHDMLRLRTDVFVVEQACAYAEIDGRDPQAVHIGGYDDGELIACARILPPDEHGVPHLGRIVVRADRRGHGVANELMLFAMAELERVHGSRRSELAAQAHLEKFYGRFGYVRQGPDYPWDGIPHVDMRRDAD